MRKGDGGPLSVTWLDFKILPTIIWDSRALCMRDVRSLL